MLSESADPRRIGNGRERGRLESQASRLVTRRGGALLLADFVECAIDEPVYTHDVGRVEGLESDGLPRNLIELGLFRQAAGGNRDLSPVYRVKRIRRLTDDREAPPRVPAACRTPRRCRPHDLLRRRRHFPSSPGGVVEDPRERAHAPETSHRHSRSMGDRRAVVGDSGLRHDPRHCRDMGRGPTESGERRSVAAFLGSARSRTSFGV